MSDHHDDDGQDTAMPRDTTATQPFPRPRLRAAPAEDGPTRLDVQSRFDVADPTAVVPPTPYRDTAGQPVYVSPPGTHTGFPYPRDVHDDAQEAAEKINYLLDERERADDRRSGRAAAKTGRTVREEAQRRAMAKMRHERHMENVETIRAYVTLAIFFCLLVIVVGAGVVGYGIIGGWFTWQPVLTP